MLVLCLRLHSNFGSCGLRLLVTGMHVDSICCTWNTIDQYNLCDLSSACFFEVLLYSELTICNIFCAACAHEEQLMLPLFNALP